MQSALTQREVLHVEVSLTDAARTVDATLLSRSIREGLMNASSIRIGRATPTLIEQLVQHTSYHGWIDAIEFDYSGPSTDQKRLNPAEVTVEIHHFFLEPEHTKLPLLHDTAVVDEHHSRIFVLPNVAFQDLWPSLLFDDRIHARTLHALIRGTLRAAASHQFKDNRINSNRSRVCLLYGPPGSGKSTTCRALAQKLGIRLAHLFPTAVLLELHATTLFSKYFGESPQLVDGFFAGVEALAQEPTRLVCVVVDEVDAIAGRRAAVQDDCRDDARTTIALLTGLDRIRRSSNVIVFATSNLKDALDPAFVDRTDEALTMHVPLPSPKAIYELLRRGIQELLQQKLIQGTPLWTAHENPRLVELRGHEMGIPAWHTMMTHFRHMSDSVPARLWKISQACAGESARKVCVMPLMAFDSEYGAESTVASNVEAMERMVERRAMAIA